MYLGTSFDTARLATEAWQGVNHWGVLHNPEVLRVVARLLAEPRHGALRTFIDTCVAKSSRCRRQSTRTAADISLASTPRSLKSREQQADEWFALAEQLIATDALGAEQGCRKAGDGLGKGQQRIVRESVVAHGSMPRFGVRAVLRVRSEPERGHRAC
ncbi:hypothetical protein [Paraburkholderia aromaticivorans]|uniref:hypothetical protein n=1 Tax=Paraburkholderia aromaticivorans TaxID=2026199 RepID=UPI0019812092|nr:hypothetical protein [Paraburkholderia aromaticivorans]